MASCWAAGLGRRARLPQAKSNQCLADQKMIDREVQMTSDVNSQYPEFAGTPSFVLNGKMLAKTRRLEEAPAATGCSAEIMRWSAALALLSMLALAVPASAERRPKPRPSPLRSADWTRTFSVNAARRLSDG